MQLTIRIKMPIFKIILKGILIFLLKLILINSTIKYKVVKNILYITIGLYKIEDTKSNFKREIRALVPPQAGQNNPK